MNPQWNTPPNGDFARYVERLSAQAALPKRTAAAPCEHGLDIGMTPTSGPQAQGPVTAAMQRAELPNGEVPRKQPGSFDPALLKVLGIFGAVAFLVLWAAGVPFGVLIVLAALAAWFGRKLKGLKLTPGVAKWQQVLEEAARKQREQQQKQGNN
ncbi:hypothetical protein [Variovorax sp. 160MFSha2.1]|uniref:hypothetical protein n=1 Tax=Variovorax sp. 160MFSha2.1 TaxID=3158367 RepID=UPI003AADC248